jgi:cytochrome c556
MKHAIIFAALMLAIFTASATIAADPDEAVTARQEILKNMGKEMKALGAIAKGDIESDRAALIDSAKHMYAQSAGPWVYFGQETSVARVDNKAKSTIWSDPKGFQTAQQNFIKAASELNQVAATGKPDDVRAKIDALGAACGACHKNFKN